MTTFTPDEEQFFGELKRKLKEQYGLLSPDDLVALERILSYYRKIKEAEKIIAKENILITLTTKHGVDYRIPHPLLSQINQWETHLRSWMRETRLTRKEKTKSESKVKDFAVEVSK